MLQHLCLSAFFHTHLMWVNPVPHCCGEWIGGNGDIALESVRISTHQRTTWSFLLYRQLSFTDCMYCQGTDNLLRDFCYKECGPVLLWLHLVSWYTATQKIPYLLWVSYYMVWQKS